ncbi:MAG TPA: hypothetical protein PKM65_02455 [Spirochaetota bacterium]|nr:hypothetical protein [Spirochaetota bacterium]HNT12055.1 hypothetical protein [Spirochaetota bacterium]HNV47926.1 hypothetical protein [Spirochaetota bacterium]HOS39930.1 hypothetical protein [Spirochaetota bacterium]HPI22429.1 hypothetical protein [Spirochaetota bacterium]
MMHGRILAFLIIASCVLGACGSKDELKKSVEAYWELIKTGEYEKSYLLCAPAYRQGHPEDNYVRNFNALFSEEGNQIRQYRIDGMDIKNGTAIVRMRLEFSEGVVEHWDDTWVRDNGTWRFNGGGKLLRK